MQRQAELDASAVERVDHWLREATGGRLVWGQGEKLAVRAAEAGDLRFATLVAQVPGLDGEVRQLLRTQVEVWRREGVRVDEDRARLFELLGGDCAKHMAEQSRWLAALALQKWFGCEALAPLREVVAQFSAKVSLGQAPRPVSPFDAEAVDGLFRVLQLACEPRRFPLSDVLAPAGLSGGRSLLPSLMLGDVLAQTGVVARPLSARQASLLRMHVVAELESAGEVGWAVYVACGLPSAKARDRAVRFLLDTAPRELREDEMAVVTRLGVDASKLARGRAWRAAGDVKQQVLQLALARDWAAWARAMHDSLAPRLVCSGELGVLGNLLDDARELGWGGDDAGPLDLFAAYLDCVRMVGRASELKVDALEGALQGLLALCQGRRLTRANAQVASWTTLRLIEIQKIKGQPFVLPSGGVPWSSDFTKKLVEEGLWAAAAS